MGILDRQGELIDVDGLLLPKYGTLKVREVEEYNNFIRRWPEMSKSLTPGQADIEACLQSLTFLLKRLDPAWTIELTRASEWTLPVDGQVGGKVATFEPDTILTDALYRFWQGELNRWPEPKAIADEETEAEEPGKQPTGKPSTGGSKKRTRASSAALKDT
jgi:hypothetical protein